MFLHTRETSNELREKQARNKIALGYDGKCLSLSENEVADLEKNQTFCKL